MSTILVVDDDDSQIKLLRSMFERAGHEVISASSGRAALNLLDIHKVDVLFTDLSMPPGMNGIELCIAEMERNHSPHTVIAAGNYYGDTRQRVRSAGIKVCLHKPFTMTEALNALQ